MPAVGGTSSPALEWMFRDCEDPPRSSVTLLGCGLVIASVTHLGTGLVPFV